MNHIQPAEKEGMIYGHPTKLNNTNKCPFFTPKENISLRLSGILKPKSDILDLDKVMDDISKGIPRKSWWRDMFKKWTIFG